MKLPVTPVPAPGAADPVSRGAGITRATFWVRLGLGLLGATAVGTSAAPPPLGPDEFRAALLSKILPLVTWPKSAFGAEDRELVIVLLGRATFAPLLDALVRDTRVGDRPVVVRTVDRLEDLPRCQILFFPADRTEEVKRLPADRSAGLLTVGEDERFTRLGGVINLSLADRALTLNIRNARGAGLALQSRLLRIARVES